MRHLLSLHDVTTDEIREILSLARKLKDGYNEGVREPILRGRVLALLFEKQSLRTRVSFEAGMAHMGGTSMFLGQDVGWGKRESPADFSRVLSELVDVVVCRAKSQDTVDTLAKYSTCPIINGLTDKYHPCQALADIFTVEEVRGSLDGAKVAYIGDANNVARSLALVCAKLGVEFGIATPKGYEFDDAFLAELKKESPVAEINHSYIPADVVSGADAVYTDVWASMGQESEQAERAKAFADYQVDAKLMSLANNDACFLHCLPAKRGQEVTDEVMDSPKSAIVQQAGNRMHAQKGVLAWLLGAK